MSFASTDFTISPVSTAVDDETQVISRDLAFALATRKGLVFDKDFAFTMSIIAIIFAEAIRRRGYINS